MKTPASRVVRIIGLFVTAAMGCHRADPSSLASVAPDSLLGVVSVTGTEFDQRIVLRAENGTTRLSATGSDSAALSRMGGVEVVVLGNRGPDFFRVASFIAVSVNGSSVADGVLKNDSGRLVLETRNGPVLLGNPPEALRGLIGARIWIGGPLDKGPNFYGLITPAP